MLNEKNFSESKTSNSVMKCRGCGEVLPKLALAFSNSVAIEQGYCAKKAYSFLEKKAKELWDKRQSR